MRGKYSPTVTAAYMADQEWWHRYSRSAYMADQEWWHRYSREAEEFTQYDPEGYDSYGYDVNDIDRAGNWECDYYHNDGDYDKGQDYNFKYDAAYDAWGFDGTKPVRK